jgi:hypothetical protein
MLTLTSLALALVLLFTQAHAATTLFDFESDDQVALWHNEGATTLSADKTLERSQAFAAGGKTSLCFWTSAWIPAEHDGAQKWPAFEGKPPLTDWSKHDRLVMEVVNVTSARHALGLLISDSRKPTRSPTIIPPQKPAHSKPSGGSPGTTPSTPGAGTGSSGATSCLTTT